MAARHRGAFRHHTNQMTAPSSPASAISRLGQFAADRLEYHHFAILDIALGIELDDTLDLVVERASSGE